MFGFEVGYKVLFPLTLGRRSQTLAFLLYFLTELEYQTRAKASPLLWFSPRDASTEPSPGMPFCCPGPAPPLLPRRGDLYRGIPPPHRRYQQSPKDASPHPSAGQILPGPSRPRSAQPGSPRPLPLPCPQAPRWIAMMGGWWSRSARRLAARSWQGVA